MNRWSLCTAGLMLLLCSYCVLCQTQENGLLTTLGDGEIHGHTYHNQRLGVSYEFPAGWVVGKPTMSEHKFAWKDDPNSPAKELPRCFRNLLFVTEHPEGMRPDGFVPMASVVAFDPSCNSEVEFPRAVDDREAVKRVVRFIEARLVAPASASSTSPRAHPVDYAGRVLLEISQSVFMSAHEAGGTTSQNLQVSISAVQAGDYWVLWLFATPNDSDMSKLKATKISFDVLPAAARQEKR